MRRLSINLPNNFRAKYWLIALATFLLITGVIGTTARTLIPKEPNPIQIAVAAPLTGRQSNAGKEMVQSIQLYLNLVNQEGGVQGHPLKLLNFDDRGDPNTVIPLARTIDDSPALVVLGHLTSPISIAAAPIYQALQIPAITGTASADRITQANPYSFRTVFTDSVQGSMLALYAQQALKLNTASVIYSDDDLGQTLDEAFETTFKRGGTLKHSWQFNSQLNNLEQSVKTIVNALAADSNPGIVFLAMDDISAKEFIVAIRRRGLKTPILGNQTIGQENFTKLFEQYDEEKERPGYFLDGVYAATPLTFDSANADVQEFVSLYQKNYGSLPSFIGAGYYDAAKVAVQAIQAAKVQDTPASRQSDRHQVRDQLAAINNRDVATKGLSGPIYFDVTHDNIPPVKIGQFVNRRLISAPIQLAPVTNLALVNLEREIKAGNLVHLTYQLKDQYFWEQRVVYTGIDINKLSRVDQNKSSFTADFYLWFRYSGNDDPLSIEFPDATSNSLNPTAPLFDPRTPLKSRVVNSLNYRLYQVRGEFKNSFDFRDYPFDLQKLVIRFQNKSRSSEHLLYAIDTFGLKLPRTDLKQQKAFQALQLWKIKELKYSQDSFRNTSTQGDPDLFGSNIQIDYPGFSAVMIFQRSTLIFLAKNLLPLALLTLVSYSTLYFSYSLSVPRILAACSALLSGIVLLLAINNQLPEVGYTVALEYAFYVFFFLSLSVIVTTAIGERLEKAGRKQAVGRLNLLARLFFPVVVFATIATYGILYGKQLL